MTYQEQAQYLESYEVFSPQAVYMTSGIADRLHGMSYDEAAEALALPVPQTKKEVRESGLEVATFTPDYDYDETRAIVYANSHGNRLSQYNRLSMGILAVVSGLQVIAVGNRAIGNPSVKLDRAGRAAARQGDYTPTGWQIAAELERRNIQYADFAGMSRGADLSLDTARASRDATEVGDIYPIEAVSATDWRPEAGPFRNLRGVGRLFKNFISTEPGMWEFVKGADNPAVTESHPSAKTWSGKLAGTKYIAGLALPTNWATARGLSVGGHAERQARTLEALPDSYVMNIYGDESELALAGAMEQMESSVNQRFPGRTQSLVIPGGKHGMAEDPFLHAAMVLEARERIAKLADPA